MRTYFLEGRRREGGVGGVGSVARYKRELTTWGGGRGRSGLVSSEMWHVTNEDSLPGGRKREERFGELGNVACHKRGLTSWRGGKGRSGLGTLETRNITNEDSLPAKNNCGDNVQAFFRS